MPVNESILTKADQIINGPRADDYGDALENMERIAAMWSLILDTRITYQQVCMMMVALKLSRLVNSPDHLDSWMDAAGYCGVWEKADRAYSQRILLAFGEDDEE